MKKRILLTIIFLFVFIGTVDILAHCDSMEGPVVKASQKALETGNINYVIVWVRAEDEQEIKVMFDKVSSQNIESGSKRTCRYVFL